MQLEADRDIERRSRAPKSPDRRAEPLQLIDERCRFLPPFGRDERLDRIGHDAHRPLVVSGALLDGDAADQVIDCSLDVADREFVHSE